MRNALSATPTVYRHFLSNTTAQLMSGLFELNVYDVLADAFRRTRNRNSPARTGAAMFAS